MKQIHLGFKKGHLCFSARCQGDKAVEVVIDTGAVTTFVFKDILIQKTKCEKEYKGVGTATSKCQGLLLTDVLSTKAVWIDDRSKSYDIILGLDWMLEHKAVIDIQTLTLTYQ